MKWGLFKANADGWPAEQVAEVELPEAAEAGNAVLRYQGKLYVYEYRSGQFVEATLFEIEGG